MSGIKRSQSQGNNHQRLSMHTGYRDQLKYALYSTFREPRLYRLALKGEWARATTRCKLYPEEASFRHKFAPYDTPLHCVLRPVVYNSIVEDMDQDGVNQIDNIRLEAVNTILEANPAGAKVADAFWRTPLHLACMTCYGPVSGLIATTILQHHVKAAKALDVEYRLPLHFFMARCSGMVSIAFLKMLLEANVEAMVSEDIVGETPLDIFERRKDAIDNYEQVEKLLDQHKLPSLTRMSVKPCKARRTSSDSTASLSQSSRQSSV